MTRSGPGAPSTAAARVVGKVSLHTRRGGRGRYASTVQIGIAAGNTTRGRPLKFELEGRQSAHRGDYRVVYRVDDEQRVVYVEAIDHRADVYRRR